MGISLQVNLSNFDAKKNCLSCLCEQYPEAVGQAMMNIAQNILATANTLVPVRTGYLKSTIANDISGEAQNCGTSTFSVLFYLSSA